MMVMCYRQTMKYSRQNRWLDRHSHAGDTNSKWLEAKNRRPERRIVVSTELFRQLLHSRPFTLAAHLPCRHGDRRWAFPRPGLGGSPGPGARQHSAS